MYAMASFFLGTTTTLGNLTFDPSTHNVYKYTITTSSGTVNMMTGGTAGQPMWLSIFNNSGGNCIISYSGLCKVTGAQFLSSGRTLTQAFISDGTYMWQVGSTTLQ
jgi:hypothetical protein